MRISSKNSLVCPQAHSISILLSIFSGFPLNLLPGFYPHHSEYAAEQWASLTFWHLGFLCRKHAASGRTPNTFIHFIAFFNRYCSKSPCLSHGSISNDDRQPRKNNLICLNWELPMGILGAVGLSSFRLSQKCWECTESSIPMNLHLLQKALSVSFPCN